MSDNFLIDRDGAVTTLTFNRPERRNCMNREVMTEMDRLIQEVRDDRTTRVLIVTGSGAAFSAGADMSAAKGVSDPAQRIRLFGERNKGLPRIIGRVFDLITRLDCLTIGAINGYAVGGGWALAAAFDFVIAAEEAEFWVPEVDLAAPYVGSPADVLTATLGPWRAREAIIMCRHFSARELYDWGMVNRVVSRGELMPAAHELASQLLKKPKRAATQSKHGVNAVFLGPRKF
ncbi:MAG: enoyl-CoA hydratase/isomerase family protein [Candidatus Binataceae bacterium]